MNALAQSAIHNLVKSAMGPEGTAALASLGGLGAISLPAIYGAATSPKGHRAEGAYRGVHRVGSGMAGGMAGGALGALGGLGLNSAMGIGPGGDGQSVAPLALGIGGALGGVYLGDRFSQYLQGGKPSWERNKKEVLEAEAPGARQFVSQIAGGMPDIVNPETSGQTDTGGDTELHSKRVNYGAGRSLSTGAGILAGRVISALIANQAHMSPGAQLATSIGGTVLGGLGGYGLGSALMGKYPTRKHPK